MGIEKSFSLAQERYAGLGVDVEPALKTLSQIPVSLHCWQGDDVGGFEKRVHIVLLETPLIRTAEASGDFTTRLALQEEAKTLPFGAVWDNYCESQGVPVGDTWLAEVKSYEKNVLSKRN